jgi:hypothetical protein
MVCFWVCQLRLVGLARAPPQWVLLLIRRRIARKPKPSFKGAFYDF